jgi:hypothetical protein
MIASILIKHNMITVDGEILPVECTGITDETITEIHWADTKGYIVHTRDFDPDAHITAADFISDTSLFQHLLDAFAAKKAELTADGSFDRVVKPYKSHAELITKALKDMEDTYSEILLESGTGQ